MAIPSKLGNMVWGVCLMDKEEILAKSRKENKDRDFVDMEAQAKAYSIAIHVGGFMCGVLAVLHVIFTETLDYGIWTVYFCVLAATMIVKFAKLRKRHELVIGLLYGACCVVFFVFYLRDALGVF